MPQSELRVQIQRVEAGDEPVLPLPSYKTAGAAGMDLCAAVAEPRVLAPGERGIIASGFAIAVPEGYEAQVRPRSGLARDFGIDVANSPGTIDADYRGEVQVILVNNGTEPFTINRGDRIAQLVVAPVSRVAWQETDTLTETVRGFGGFGHTGRQ